MSKVHEAFKLLLVRCLSELEAKQKTRGARGSYMQGVQYDLNSQPVTAITNYGIYGLECTPDKYIFVGVTKAAN